MKLGLIGCGKMGGALLNGILKTSGESITQVQIYDTYAPSSQALAESTGGIAMIAAGIDDLVENSEVILLCVKPCDVQAVMRGASKWDNKLVLSIAAGVKTTTIAAYCDYQARVIRIMPNTPALIGQGASAFCCGNQTTEQDSALAIQLLNGVGTASEIKESLMDAVTGLSGSGPAYVYTMIEALSDAGVKQGLPRDIAHQLAAQTLKGASMMVQETELHPAVLREQVTSPGGTTIAGLSALEEKGIRTALDAAVSAATKRSQEIE